MAGLVSSWVFVLVYSWMTFIELIFLALTSEMEGRLEGFG